MAIDLPYSPEEMADRLAIQHVLSRYVHALDARDYDSLDDVFLPDCTFDLSDAGAPVAPWTEIKGFYSENLEKFVHYFHAFTNTLIEFNEDRSAATSISKVINPAGMVGGDGQVHFFEMIGHYHDRWIRTDVGWRICGRRWEQGWIWGDYPFAKKPGDFTR